MDHLSQLMQHFSVKAGVFYTGTLCGISRFDDPAISTGHLHLLKRGGLTIIDVHNTHHQFDKPTLVFIPRPSAHSLHPFSLPASKLPATLPSEAISTELVCATVDYGAGTDNLFTTALPSLMAVSLDQTSPLSAIVEQLFSEAFSQSAGKKLIIDRLCEILLILLIRQSIEQKTLDEGMLAGLSHPKLAKVLELIHNEPEKTYSMTQLASEAAMSRTVFMASFKSIVGTTPGDYQMRWRVELAQSLLKKGKALAYVAEAVGYSNRSGFARAFRKVTGVSPTSWLAEQ
ncbi:AraC family transcriptional regulator [Photobacterium sp. BZF1]|uniref:AraC family transcriptional regulator n=1 Tax=Photobacterium sp. BZF1 TaxID=1904457 RepID=UPI0016535390|nr:AraC family transcriptional regulator [Photobacterium sp. BZF1]MBC7005398.1 AraC family transcriptional regulator [Photobacterium sp. BZF1]